MFISFCWLNFFKKVSALTPLNPIIPLTLQRISHPLGRREIPSSLIIIQMRSADELEKGEKENVKLLSDGALHRSTPRRRRVIRGTCLVILAFAVFTWLSIYFGALNSEVKNGDVVVWTEDRRLRAKMSAETRGGGGSWHDVIIKQADCRIDGTALSEDASTGATVDFLNIRMDFKNFMVVQRQRSSEERSAVEVDVSEVNFNAAWETVQAIQVGRSIIFVFPGYTRASFYLFLFFKY